MLQSDFTPVTALSTIEGTNSYQMPASRELDAFIHHRVLKSPLSHDYPKYSTDPKEAENLRRILQRKFHTKIVSSNASVSGEAWLARYELEAGNPTEVLASSYPLAICRLAVLLASRG